MLKHFSEVYCTKKCASDNIPMNCFLNTTEGRVSEEGHKNGISIKFFIVP